MEGSAYMASENYYDILGISKDADDKQIQRAYRKLAHKYHPDSNDSKEAEEKFKKINEAYNVLKDPEKRKAYNQYGHAWEQGQAYNAQDFSSWGGDEDILKSVFESIFRANSAGGARGSTRGGFSGFSNFGGFSSGFGGNTGYSRQAYQQKGQNSNAELDVTVEEAYLGSSKKINLNVPSSAGYTNKVLDVNIPKGITSGKKIRLKGQGMPGINGGPNGDLLIKVNVVNDKKFELKGKDIYTYIKITPWEAAFGTKVEVENFGKKVQMKIPAKTQSGQKFRIKGKGFSDKKGTGDLYIVARIVLPDNLTKDEEKLLKEWKKISDFNPRS